jgi:hypothetical protein
MSSSVAAIGAILLSSIPTSRVAADESDKKPQQTTKSSTAATQNAATTPEQSIPEINLLDARRQGLVSVAAEGRGDGRMTISVTNRTRHPLRVILPPGLIAEGATGHMGGMGGMGGGMGF